jgi:hypothetical protein
MEGLDGAPEVGGQVALEGITALKTDRRRASLSEDLAGCQCLPAVRPPVDVVAERDDHVVGARPDGIE